MIKTRDDNLIYECNEDIKLRVMIMKLKKKIEQHYGY